MHEDECECELCCKDAYLTMKTSADKIRDYIEPLKTAGTAGGRIGILARIVEHLLGGCEGDICEFPAQAIEAAAGEIT